MPKLKEKSYQLRMNERTDGPNQIIKSFAFNNI